MFDLVKQMEELLHIDQKTKDKFFRRNITNEDYELVLMEIALQMLSAENNREGVIDELVDYISKSMTDGDLDKINNCKEDIQ